MSAWIKVYANLPLHPKIFALAKELGVDRQTAVGIMVCLWAWAAENSPSGDLSGLDDDAINFISGIKNKKKNLKEALKKINLASEFSEKLFIHDWDEHNSALMDAISQKKDSSKDRVKRYRERQKELETKAIQAQNVNSAKNEACTASPDVTVNVTDDVTLHETPCNVTVTPLDKNRIDKTRVTKKSLSCESDKEAPSGASHTHPGKPKNEPRKKYGEYGRVMLTDAEHGRLVEEYGEAVVGEKIAYVDQSAQSTGNKNGWRDWNLVVRKAIREGWGSWGGQAKPPMGPRAAKKPGLNPDRPFVAGKSELDAIAKVKAEIEKRNQRAAPESECSLDTF